MKKFRPKLLFGLRTILLAIICSGAIWFNLSCDEDDPTSGQDCGPKPYEWNVKSSRCLNGAGQTVSNKCCGR